MKGNILYARKQYDKAFDKLYEECKLSIDTKHMRLPRALELLTEKLMQLKTGKTKEICNNLIKKWESEKLHETKTDLVDVCNLIIEYRPYILEVKPKDKIIVS